MPQNISKLNFVNFKKNIKIVASKNIKRLIDFSIKNKINSRLCLHQNNIDKHQEMIIVQNKYNYFPPKKNTKSDQTFLILKGKLLIITFSDKGKVISSNILSKNDCNLIRVKKNTYHCDIPISQYSVHLETKNAVFNSKLNKFAKFNFNLNDFLKKINLKNFRK